jgi:hypothetical protein
MTDPILERIANKDGSLSVEQLIQEVINARSELVVAKDALRYMHDNFHQQQCTCYITDLLKGFSIDTEGEPK